MLPEMERFFEDVHCISELLAGLDKRLQKVEDSQQRTQQMLEERFVTPAELEKMFGKGRQTIKNWIKDGEIASVEINGQIRIPMSQFYGEPKFEKLLKEKQIKDKAREWNENLKQALFG